ncbi:hypothetical protein [Campylobacter sp. 7477a]|uniref:hypothetical protein n=1 Tax=Campylobacter sp. 7477a TaxID=2735741 RepID=UPI0030145F7E|nr:hypothetical protein [Campylobacter sp. 7477a]
MQNILEGLKALQERLQTSKLDSESLNVAIIQEIQNSLQSLSESLMYKNSQKLNLMFQDIQNLVKEGLEKMDQARLEDTKETEQALRKTIRQVEVKLTNLINGMNNRIDRSLTRSMVSILIALLVGAIAGAFLTYIMFKWIQIF